MAEGKVLSPFMAFIKEKEEHGEKRIRRKLLENVGIVFGNCNYAV